MALRTLGETDLSITPIGIGAWAIGGGSWEFAWGDQNDAQSIGAIHRRRPGAVTVSINGADMS